MMKLVVVADLHGQLPVIPQCDALVIAGDLCPDFPRIWDPSIMRDRQMMWLKDVYAIWESQVPAKRILMIPGNHDWIIGMPDGLRTEMFIDESVIVEGLSVWFSPWVSPIGSWNYMLRDEQRFARFREMPNHLDVLVTHSPSYHCGDMTIYGTSAGCRELRRLVTAREPRYHVFGHIHEGKRSGHLAKTKWYNCSCAMPNNGPTEILVEAK